MSMQHNEIRRVIIAPGQQLIIQERGSHAESSSVEYHVGARAHCVIIDQDDDVVGSVVSDITIICEADAQVTYIVVMAAAKAHDKTIRIMLQGARARVAVRGAYLLTDEQRVHVRTRQEHRGAETASDLLFKGIVAEKAQVIYEGMIHIAANAYRANADQQNKTLLMGDHASAQSIPALEVLTHDVRCAHGSAIGQLDREHLLYLQSRGISMQSARQLLVKGFLADILEHLPSDTADVLIARMMDKVAVDKFSVTGAIV
ncbi:MAG TPA: SufD family Fe-S cluster assembly protein [Candidatus Babeliales bacterium]|nr:SufD family Fe-S cluster assembly protein [Candidatus Babeliales bacterium]